MASKRRLRRVESARCEDKRRHLDEISAIRHIQLAEQSGDWGLNYYRCTSCGYYHVGHKGVRKGEGRV